ncbi:serine aminopeptidase domain-containing protein [Pseudoroseomonas wenyumeiae]
MPALGFPAAAGGISASDNLDALRRNGRDPLVIKITRIDAAWGLLDAMDRATQALPRCCAVPVLILQGAKDGVVPPGVTRAALRRMPPGPRLARYPDGFHLLLRDKVRGTVAADLLAWMADPARHCPRAPTAWARPGWRRNSERKGARHEAAAPDPAGGLPALALAGAARAGGAGRAPYVPARAEVWDFTARNGRRYRVLVSWPPGKCRNRVGRCSMPWTAMPCSRC